MAPVTLSTASWDTIGYNLCFARLEQRQPGGWRFIGPNTVRQAYEVMMAPG